MSEAFLADCACYQVVQQTLELCGPTGQCIISKFQSACKQQPIACGVVVDTKCRCYLQGLAEDGVSNPRRTARHAAAAGEGLRCSQIRLSCNQRLVGAFRLSQHFERLLELASARSLLQPCSVRMLCFVFSFSAAGRLQSTLHPALPDKAWARTKVTEAPKQRGPLQRGASGFSQKPLELIARSPVQLCLLSADGVRTSGLKASANRALQMKAQDIIVRASGLSASCTFPCEARSAIRDVKVLIEGETGIPARELRICFGERELRDGEKLSEIVETDELDLSFLRRDPEQALWLELVMQDPDGTFLAEAPSHIRDDSEVVLAAVMQNGKALEFASDRLRCAREVVLQSLEEDSAAFGFASPSLHADQDIMLLAVNRNGLTLAHATDELKGNHQLVAAAVCQNGLALRFASPRLQADREIVAMAVENDSAALQFAAQELQSDSELQNLC